MIRQPSFVQFFTSAAIIFSAWPVLADTAVIQNGSQDTVIYGNKNRVIQLINQASTVNSRAEPTAGDTGLIQDSAQGLTIVGDKNRVRQVVIQATDVNQFKPRMHKHGRRKNSEAPAE